MLRRFLTCLALLTGFAAAGAPAQALIVETEVALVEAALHDAASAPAAIALAQNRTERTTYTHAPSVRPVARKSAPWLRSIHLRIDRARE